jgi:hypothetical protein
MAPPEIAGFDEGCGILLFGIAASDSASRGEEER